MNRRPESGVRTALFRKAMCGASPSDSISLAITAALNPSGRREGWRRRSTG